MNIQQNVSLKSYNTLNLTSTAQYFCQINDLQTLNQVLNWQQTQGLANPFILGGGSNIVLPEYLPGLTLFMAIEGIELSKKTQDHSYLKVMAGNNWHDFVMQSSHYGYGLENLALIPGTVGASPVQNIGAYGVEVGNLIESVEAIDLTTRQAVVLNQSDCQFTYRNSVFKQKSYIITAVNFKLNLNWQVNLNYKELQLYCNEASLVEDVQKAIIQIRQKKLPNPKQQANVGSFFKNPIVTETTWQSLLDENPNLSYFNLNGITDKKISAAWLIEQSGLKGYEQNGVGMSAQHSLVLINYTAKTQSHILEFAEHVQQAVKHKFNLMLEIEPIIL